MFDPPAMLFRHHRVVYAAAAASSPPPVKAVYKALRRRYKNSRCLRSLLYGDGGDLVDRGGGGWKREEESYDLLSYAIAGGISLLLFFYGDSKTNETPRQRRADKKTPALIRRASWWRAPTLFKVAPHW